MLKKSVICLLFISLLGLTSENSSNGFFKKKKDKKEVVEQKKEEKKIIFAQIFASWCPGCKNIQPTIDQIVKENTDINFVQLDVSTPSKAKASAKLAKDLKIEDFYNANKSKTATVAIIIPDTSEIVTVLQNNNEIEAYEVALNEARNKQKESQNPTAETSDKG